MTTLEHYGTKVGYMPGKIGKNRVRDAYKR